jgi:hypothetical protein
MHQVPTYELRVIQMAYVKFSLGPRGKVVVSFKEK